MKRFEREDERMRGERRRRVGKKIDKAEMDANVNVNTKISRSRCKMR